MSGFFHTFTETRRKLGFPDEPPPETSKTGNCRNSPFLERLRCFKLSDLMLALQLHPFISRGGETKRPCCVLRKLQTVSSSFCG
jgi:hypothetical protein